MPVPNPNTIELARAGALIVGVRRRDAAVLREIERRSGLLHAATKGGGVPLLIGAFVLGAGAWAITGAAAAMVAVVALLFSWMSLTAALAPKAIERELGYHPTELAQLVGYVEAPEDGQPRISGLGQQAVAAYLAWREPRVGEAWR